MIHPGYFLPKPDLNIHLHLGGFKAVGDAQQDDDSGKDNRAIERKSIKFQYV